MRSWLLIAVGVLVIGFAAASLFGMVPWQQTACDDAGLETRVEINGELVENAFTSGNDPIPVSFNSLVFITAEFKPRPPKCTGDYNIDWQFKFESDPFSVELLAQPSGETVKIMVGSRAATDLVVFSPRSPSGPLPRRYLFLDVQEE